MSTLENKYSQSNYRHVSLAVPIFAWMIVYLLCIHDLKQLFWFGDAWQLLDQVQEIGYVNWIFTTFAENFVPFFKTIWFGSIKLFNGSHFVVISLLWLNHLLNIWLWGRVLFRWGLGSVGVFTCLVFFGLSLTNIETLGWSIQWSSVMATTFLICVLYLLHDFLDEKKISLNRTVVMFFICIALSALSFSRGVLTGLVPAVVLLMPYLWQGSLKRRFFSAVGGGSISLVVVIIILGGASGNHTHLNIPTLFAAIDWSFHFYALNPIAPLLKITSTDMILLWGLFLLKTFIYIYSFMNTCRERRIFIVTLGFFDVANALLVGIGRYHTGLEASTSSRYQYQTLMFLVPCVVILIEVMMRQISEIKLRVVSFVWLAIIAVIGLSMLNKWPDSMRDWAAWRGVPTIRVLMSENPPETGAMPGIPFLPTKKAKELKEAFNLH